MADLVRSLFRYPEAPHQRGHYPAGYTDYRRYKDWLRDEFKFQCAYCLMRENWYPSGDQAFSVDHIQPQTEAPSLICEYTNLVYACVRCNSARQNRTVLNPCAEALGAHLRVNEDGSIEALTTPAISHITVLHLNDSQMKEYRRRMTNLVRQLQTVSSPQAESEMRKWFGFPRELPNLAAMRPPGGNSLPEGLRDCYYEKNRRGELPDTY